MIDRVGHQLGNYRLIRLLGRGGFADIYLGEHVYLKSLAALKVLRLSLSEEERVCFPQGSSNIDAVGTSQYCTCTRFCSG